MTTPTTVDQTAKTGADILAGYSDQEEFSRVNNISPRTIARYRNQVDGLPWVTFGGRVFIPLAEAAEWLRSQIRRPNKRRAA
jgi:hypothetical protein